MSTLNKLSLNLWFANQAEDAAKFYTFIFKHSSIGKKSYYGKEGFDIHKMPEGSVMVIEFELEGMPFLGLNGGPVFKFNEAISIIVNCDDAAEVDYYWERLTEDSDPKSHQCGWLKDKFGLSWQVVPTALAKMMSNPDKGKAGRVMAAMLQMKKIDLHKLEQAFKG